jgi:hypothetical protein
VDNGNNNTTSKKIIGFSSSIATAAAFTILIVGATAWLNNTIQHAWITLEQQNRYIFGLLEEQNRYLREELKEQNQYLRDNDRSGEFEERRGYYRYRYP